MTSRLAYLNTGQVLSRLSPQKELCVRIENEISKFGCVKWFEILVTFDEAPNETYKL